MPAGSSMSSGPPRRVARPLGAKHFQWWCRAHGAKYELAAPPRVARDPPKELLDSLFSAIRENHVGQVERILALYPHLGFTKGSEQRTALYFASFFARFEIVKLLLARGADRQLSADGVLPSAVVGYGRRDAVGEMKVRCLLADTDEIHVLLLAASHSDVASMARMRRVHIYFSEPVGDFIQDDLRTSHCTVETFTRMSADVFTATVRVASGMAANAVPCIEILAGAVAGRGKVANRTNVASNMLQLE